MIQSSKVNADHQPSRKPSGPTLVSSVHSSASSRMSRLLLKSPFSDGTDAHNRHYNHESIY